MRKFCLLFVLLVAGFNSSILAQYAGTGTFTKITNIDDLTDGYYVIVNSGDGFAMNNTNTGSFFGNTVVTPSSGTLTNPATTIVWYISTSGSGRSIYTEASSKYVSYSGSSNAAYAVDAVSGDAQRWSFTYSSGSNVFTVTNVGTSTRILQYNSSSPRFACYTSGQQNLLLYKLQSSVANPTSFNASVNSATQINLAASANGNGNNILVAWNSINSFGTPSGSYSVGGPISGGGTVLYIGSAASLTNHTGLNANTQYFYKAWSVNGSNEYSSGITANGTTNGLGTPTANSASLIGTTSFTANWGSVNGATSYRLDVASSNEFDVTQNIATESFENSTSVFVNNNGSFYSGNSGAGDLPASSPYATLGTYGLGVTGTGSATRSVLTSGSINTSGSTSNELSFRLSAFSPGGGNGLDGGDSVTIEISPDNGVNYFKTLQVRGNNNAYWSFNSVNIASTPYDGDNNAVIFQSGTGATDGYSTLKVTSIPSSTSLRIRITLLCDGNAERWVIDDFKLTGNVTNAISGYNNLTVNSASQVVTGLTPGTTYYYRVRGHSTNSTSSNSNVITVTTANNSQSTAIGGTGSQNVTVSGTTGVGGIQFTNVTTPGDILVSRFNNTPADHGLTGSVSNYRWIIEPGNSLVINQAEGYQLRFNIADCPGIAELTDGDNTTIKLYKRSTPGSGAFTGPIALTYNRNGSPGNQSDDYLLSALITDGFSEFVFNSPSEPLPVELSAFSASTTHNSVTLNWETKTEINNYGFEIERTTESGTWAKIAFVAGNGNSNSPKRYSYTDKSVTAGKYQYRLKQIDSDGQFEYSKAIEADLGKVTSYALEQNYPNPFNPTTVIRFSLVENSSVRLDVYSSIGELVHTLANQTYEAGNHAINFDASQLSAGIYLYRITAIDATGKTFSAVKKMQLIK